MRAPGRIAQAEHESRGRAGMLPPVHGLVYVGREGPKAIEVNAPRYDARGQCSYLAVHLGRQPEDELEGVLEAVGV